MSYNSRLRHGSRSQRGGYPPPAVLPSSVIEGQDTPLPGAYDPRVQPDIANLNREQREIARSHVHQRGKEKPRGQTIKPVGLRSAGAVVLTGAAAGIPARTPLVQALQQNSKRKRLIVCNPSLNGCTVWMAFGGGGVPVANWIEIGPGSTWDESGTGIITEEVWVATSASAISVGYYEGIEDENS